MMNEQHNESVDNKCQSDETLEQNIWNFLKEVKDPEIPSVSIIDMGMVMDVKVKEPEAIHIQMIPTFVGCPALEMIRKAIVTELNKQLPNYKVTVDFVFDIPWSSDRINEEGRQNLKKHGIAPPPRETEAGGVWEVDCPYCNSPKTVIDNLFGPTACRSILYCTHCKNPFEAIKPV